MSGLVGIAMIHSQTKRSNGGSAACESQFDIARQMAMQYYDVERHRLFQFVQALAFTSFEVHQTVHRQSDNTDGRRTQALELLVLGEYKAFAILDQCLSVDQALAFLEPARRFLECDFVDRQTGLASSQDEQAIGVQSGGSSEVGEFADQFASIIAYKSAWASLFGLLFWQWRIPVPLRLWSRRQLGFFGDRFLGGFWLGGPGRL